MEPILPGKVQGIPNNFYRVSIKGLILDKTRTKFAILLEEKGWWELPGGGLDWGESPTSCLRREFQEEMGLTINQIAQSPSYILTGENMRGNWTLNVVYEVEVEDLNFTASDECQEIRFVAPEEIKSLQAFRTVKELGEQFDPKKHLKP